MDGLGLQILAAILLGPLLWLAGAIGFDAVHWLLHRMLRSRWGLLRTLAWPHAVHHQWIDRELVTHFDRQRANVWCHIVPEYLTQLAFTGALALLLPLPFAAVVGVLQTGVFAAILRMRGLDVNHRPGPRIDAHPPGWLTPPAYHALHHAWPDAHFSAYTKWVDRIVGGGAQIAERSFRFVGADSPFARALRGEVERRGGASPAEPADPDVLVLLDPDAPLAPPVEAFIDATRERQLPPEVWALRRRADDARARHYRDDVRVCFRTLLVPADSMTEAEARRAARRALFWIRRDAHFAAPAEPLGLAALRRFLATRPQVPAGIQPVRHRVQLAPRGASNPAAEPG
jgi:hypothetical protein